MCKELNIGKALRKIRKERSISQGDIYRATGIERSHISKIESGEIKDPKLSTMFRICNAIGMKVSEFIQYAENHQEQ